MRMFLFDTNFIKKWFVLLYMYHHNSGECAFLIKNWFVLLYMYHNSGEKEVLKKRMLLEIKETKLTLLAMTQDVRTLFYAHVRYFSLFFISN